MCHRVEQKEVMGEFKPHLDYHQNDVRNVVFFQGAQWTSPISGIAPLPLTGRSVPQADETQLNARPRKHGREEKADARKMG